MKTKHVVIGMMAAAASKVPYVGSYLLPIKEKTQERKSGMVLMTWQVK